jgi:hypothetical protein
LIPAETFSAEPYAWIFYGRTDTATTSTYVGDEWDDEYWPPAWTEDQEKIINQEIKRKRHAAQWILREGPFLRFNPTPTQPIRRQRSMVAKILRCNRKGIGLRQKEEK